ncbi:MAG: HU family DNA-binding protein [Nitrospirae bacterium]|nr:HU family DNA-binding protein [Nitrospirota bacterium]
MTKADIVNAIYGSVGLPKKEAEDIVEAIIDLMKETMAEGEGIKIPNFGSFNVRKKRRRRGRNPQTGLDIEITQRTVVTLKVAGLLKKMVE